ncbi:MAG: aspartate-semialdehyde dehydrogenase [Candidatus Omnitrophota bacterium]
MGKSYNVAIVGATGLVGGKFLEVLERRKFPVKNIRLLASGRSKGKKLKFLGKAYDVEELTKDSFKGIDVALFSAGAGISREFAPIAAKSGAVVVDNSSAFRMDPDVPLVVPEVNPGDIKKHKGIIANPNCSTIQMVVVLKPLHDAAKIKRIVVATYQSASGWGKEAVDQLWQETELAVKSKNSKIPKGKVKQVLPSQIAFNVIPHIDVFEDNGYTKEEMKMSNETKKIMGDDSIQVTATCVRVGVVGSHSEAVNIEFERKLEADDAVMLLKNADGVEVLDDVERSIYPLPIDAEGKDMTYVGRIRQDETVENGLNLWIVSDNLLKGAALNAVQIAELL